MNAIFASLALTLAASASALAAPALKGPLKGDPPPIIGEWMLTEWLQMGQSVGFTQGASVEFQKDDKRIWRDGPGAEADHRGYKLIPKTTPHAIDLIRPSGGGPPDVFPGIYKVEGDTLVVAVANSGGERPKNFEDKEVVYQMMTYKRIKKD